MTPNDQEPFATLLGDIIASQYVTYAAFTLLIYDHILTFADECRFIWRARFNWVKGLFVFNRYIVPTCIAINVAMLSGHMRGLSDISCRTWIAVEAGVKMISLLSTSLLIAMRVNAVCGARREITKILGAVYNIHALACMVVFVFVTARNTPSFTLQPQLNTCIGNINGAWATFLPAMFFHAVIFGILLWKTLATPRSAKTPLLRVLLRDGFIYFFVIFLAMFANLMIWALARQSLAQLPHYAVWAISITAITRLLLSLHHVGAPTKRHSHAMPMRRLDSGHGSQHDATPEVIDDAFRKFIERYFDVDDPRNSDDSLPDYDHTYGPRRHFAPTVIHLPNLKFDHA